MTNLNALPENESSFAAAMLKEHPSAAIFSRTAMVPNKEEEVANTVSATPTKKGGGPAVISSASVEQEIYKDMINPGLFDDFYRREKRLQNGTYGVVYEASSIVNNSKERFAVKVIDRFSDKIKEKDVKAVFREVAILKELVDVEHVITLKDFFVSPTTLYVVQNLACGGDVFDRLVLRKTYTEAFARDLVKVLLQTIHQVHERRIVHRDLKPGNLLLRDANDDCSILLADFGFATHLNSKGYCKTRCGTPSYVAPEVILEVPYTQQVDMFSIGSIIYMLLCGYAPFQAANHRELFRRIRAGNFTFHESSWENVSIPAKQLIAHCLTVNPKKRCTAQQALESAWIQPSRPQHLSENDLSEALNRIRSRRKLKAAMDAVRWAATARFWNPDTVTFSQQLKTWDKAITEQVEQQKSVSSASSASSTTTTSTGATPTLSPKVLKPPKLIPFQECYTLQRKIRKGDFATVWECQHNASKEIYAVKIIPRQCLSTSHDEMVLNEVSILQSVSGQDGIIELVDFYEHDEAFYLVMELLAGGDVFDRIIQKAVYTELEARSLVKRLLKAVQALHKKGIAHRDIKPQNLLLQSKDDDSNIVLCDFGFARRVHTPQSLTQRVGSPPYVAPEILKNIPHDERVDMWSVGVTVYVLLVGYAPFAHENREIVCQQIKAGSWSFYKPDWRGISYEAKELVEGLLHTDPVERWSPDEALRCAWFQASDEVLSSRDLSGSVTNLKGKRTQLRSVANKTMTWLANKKKDILHHGFVSQQITSPTQANEIVADEDSVRNLDVKGLIVK